MLATVRVERATDNILWSNFVETGVEWASQEKRTVLLCRITIFGCPLLYHLSKMLLVVVTVRDRPTCVLPAFVGKGSRVFSASRAVPRELSRAEHNLPDGEPALQAPLSEK